MRNGKKEIAAYEAMLHNLLSAASTEVLDMKHYFLKTNKEVLEAKVENIQAYKL